MSVAFRRESDEEHLEPKFEIPIPAGRNLVTQEGLEQIFLKVAELKALLLTQTDESQVAATKRSLRYWNTRHATAEIMPRASSASVTFGAQVTFALNGVTRSVRIVGDDQADPANGLISFSAPLSRAMMGAEPCDLLPYSGKADALEIIDIS